MAPVFSALGDPTRLAVIRALGRSKATISALAAGFDMALPTFLRHIRVLEDVGLVISEKRGRVRTCRLNPDRLAAAETCIGDIRTLWTRRLDGLEDFLGESRTKDEDNGDT